MYGDQERRVGLDERPLALFEEMDREGKKPMFMLKKASAAVAEARGANTMSAGSSSAPIAPPKGTDMGWSSGYLPGSSIEHDQENDRPSS